MFVSFTTTAGAEVCINPDMVAYFAAGQGVQKDTTFITMSTIGAGESDFFHVEESLEEVKRKLNIQLAIYTKVAHQDADLEKLRRVVHADIKKGISLS